MKLPNSLSDIYRENVKVISQLRKELLSARFRPLIYATERRSRIRQLQRENAEITRVLQSQQPRLPGDK